VHGILTFFKRLAGHGFQSLHQCFVSWTTPDTTSLLLLTLTDIARNTSELVAENALLRHQLIILRRQMKRPACTKTDRMLLVLLASMVRTWKQALFIVQPETLLRWHRQGFKLYWKYKSRAKSATPKISAETIALIKEMARDNRLWGAERIRGELLKLGMHVCKRTIQKYMRAVRTTRPRGADLEDLFTHACSTDLGLRLSPSHRSLLPLALRLLHCRTALPHSDSCRRYAISHGHLDRTYLFGKPPPLVWVRGISSVIVITSSDPVSLAWPHPAASRS